MVKLTKPQRKSLHSVWKRSNEGMSYRAFRKSVVPCFDCVVIKWCGMWLGIEKDGYTHS